MAFSELRVHGMSGTPPRELLYSDPVSYDYSDPWARVYETNRDGRGVKAFHWGSLTSGSRATALWLLLTPFMLANLAGWMASTRRPVQAFIRLTGLSISCLLVAQGAVVSINQVNQVAAGQDYHNLAVAGGAMAIALFYLFIVWRLSTQSLVKRMTSRQKLTLLMGVSEESLRLPGVCKTLDPAPDANLADWQLWIRQTVLHRLRRQHLAGGLLVIPIAIELGLGPSPVFALALLLAMLVLADVTLFSAPDPLGDLVRRASRSNVHLAVVLLIWSVVRLLTTDLPDGPWPHIHQLVLYIAFLSGAGALGTLVAQLATGQGSWQQSFLPLSALAIGATVGGALGVAAALFAELASYRFLGDLNPYDHPKEFNIANTEIMINGGAWTVQSMLCFLMAMICFAAVAVFLQRHLPLPDREHGRGWAIVRRVTTQADWVFGATGAIALVLAVPAVFISCQAPGIWVCDPDLYQMPTFIKVLPTIAMFIGIATLIALTFAAWQPSKGTSFLLLVGGGFLLWLVWNPDFNTFSWTVPIIDLPVRPARFLDLSVVVIVFGLTFFILRSIIGSFGDPEKRRKVGMLWDVGSFWPRWFHPLAPPSYAPHAVQRLREVLASERPHVLTAHSQGSVIASVTLAQRRAPVPRALLTSGSPLGILYASLFPFVGVQRLIERVRANWGDTPHWINLWRDTDPLGGGELPGMDGNRPVVEGVGHSAYELTKGFITARRDAINGV